MKNFRYLFEKKDRQDIWVCENCKKDHSELILRGKWKLIGRCRNSEVLCYKCDVGKPAAYEYLAAN